MKSIAERFKYLRHQAQLSQSEFADIIHLSQGRLSDIERGKNKPSADTLLAVSEYFNISTDWLLLGTGKPPALADGCTDKRAEEDQLELSDSERYLIWEYRKLDKAGRKQIWDFIDYLLFLQRSKRERLSSGVPELEG
ncbi:MAG: family transcriptional regulator [Paenibacillaceae bacterium]|jgi:transcriptional regulator with XRE-family HTH domain|nr:family transcriptional regulator [Paenibacillaceae bacterium]